MDATPSPLARKLLATKEGREGLSKAVMGGEFVADGVRYIVRPASTYRQDETPEIVSWQVTQ